MYESAIRSWVDSEIWIFPGSPLDSIRLAVLTVSPQMSYWNFMLPMTPATAGPELMPIRKLRDPQDRCMRWAADLPKRDLDAVALVLYFSALGTRVLARLASGPD